MSKKIKNIIIVSVGVFVVFAIGIFTGSHFLHNDTETDFNETDLSDSSFDEEVSNSTSSQADIILDSSEKAIAEIIIDNESVWLDPLNEKSGMSSYNFCWFEDFDFDPENELEFIVGGSGLENSDNIGTFGTNCYYVYRITNDGKLENVIDSDDETEDFISFLPKQSYISSSFGNGLMDVGMEVIRDISGEEYERIFISEATGGDFYGLNLLTVYSHKTLRNREYYDIDKISEFDNTRSDIGEQEYWDIVFPAIDCNEEHSHCAETVLTIPCTYSSKNYTDGEFDCYDNLSYDEKLIALVKSYDGYSLKNTDEPSEVLEKYLEKTKNISSPEINHVYDEVVITSILRKKRYLMLI